MTLGAPVVLDVAQQGRMPMGPHLCIAELARPRRLDPTAELLGHGLHPIADPEHRDAQIEHPRGRRDLWGGGNGLGPPREHDATRGEGPEHLVRAIVGVDLAIDPRFADAAGDELRVLGAEVEDQDPVAVGPSGTRAAVRAPAVNRLSRRDNSAPPW
jgi:hypothetical protein